MLTGYCMHELPAGTCADCAPKPARPAFAEQSEMGPWITARFGSDCAAASSSSQATRSAQTASAAGSAKTAETPS